jgi:SAM-dependent methyltransferase
MGGSGPACDARMMWILELLDEAPLDSVQTVLDIGIGRGQAAFHLVAKGKKVTGTGLEISSYGADCDRLAIHGIEVIECDVTRMPFADASFDSVLMSHILEHCLDIGSALVEVRRVLRDDGLLMIMVPPYDDQVCAGHVTTGWNIGQLMYVLLLAGFDIGGGRFIEHGYNVCGFVRKSLGPLPPLRCDRGDIALLNRYFPVPIHSQDGTNDGYFGKLKAVNWPQDSPLLQRSAWRSKKFRLTEKACALLPASLAIPVGKLLKKVADLLLLGSANPRSLR